jgi:holo-[acyl-carrier protein] synthase
MTEPSRLKDRLERHPELAGELFRPGEVAYSEAQPFPIENLAARFCAKEAIVKALGLDGFDPLDVEILAGGEQCRVALHGEVAERAKELGVAVSVSLTHVPSMAAAVALALPSQGRPFT